MVTTYDAGNFDVIVGTATEIANAIKGKSKDNIIALTHNGTNYCVIIAR